MRSEKTAEKVWRTYWQGLRRAINLRRLREPGFGRAKTAKRIKGATRKSA